MYSPTLGRFLQTDPIGYEDQVNLYAYVANDPVNGTDFSGMAQDDKEFRIPQLIGKVEGSYNDSSVTIRVDNPIYSGEVTLSTSGVSGSVTAGNTTVAGAADQSGAAGRLLSGTWAVQISKSVARSKPMKAGVLLIFAQDQSLVMVSTYIMHHKSTWLNKAAKVTIEPMARPSPCQGQNMLASQQYEEACRSARGQC